MRPLPLLPALLALSFLSACSGGKEDAEAPADSADDTGGQDSGTDTDEDTDPTQDTDVRNDMQENADGCQDYGGNAVPGAASYFVGDYVGNATDGWTGTEEWWLWANGAWKERGGEDCVVVWNVDATPADPGACGACETGLAIDAAIDATRTTCPTPLWEGLEYWSESYAMDQLPDGAARWYFAETGTPLGDGWWTESTANWISDRACTWF
jgi:hypothetical protein